MAKGKPLAQEQLDTIAKLAGTMPDEDAAKEAKCSIGSVFTYRKQNNILAYNKKIIKETRNKLCGIVGSVAKSDIAKIIDVSVNTIERYKKENNICKQDTKASDGAKRYYCSLKDLHTKLKQYAGTMTDAQVAQQCGCSVTTVKVYRKKHNIPPDKTGSGRRFSDEQKLKIAELLKDSSYSDKHIAIIIGCGDNVINLYREKLGYPKYINTKPAIDYEKIKELAGTMIDRDVAKECNCADTTVQGYRKKNGIPVFKTKSQ